MQASDIDDTLVHYNDVLDPVSGNDADFVGAEEINVFDHPTENNIMSLSYRSRCSDLNVSSLIAHARYLDIKHNRNSQVNENFFVAFETNNTDVKALNYTLRVNGSSIPLKVNDNIAIDTGKQ